MLCIYQDIRWHHIVVDEGHRLKNKQSNLLERLTELNCERRILMTGTPIQNNTAELWTLINFLEPTVFKSEADFKTRFGALQESEQVRALMKVLKPFLLRRRKEDVEKSIPPKVENIIEIELTTLQKRYYRAIYEKNKDFFLARARGKERTMLNNIQMELRKCCNHPWLINNAEISEIPQQASPQTYTPLLPTSLSLCLCLCHHHESINQSSSMIDDQGASHYRGGGRQDGVAGQATAQAATRRT